MSIYVYNKILGCLVVDIRILTMFVPGMIASSSIEGGGVGWMIQVQKQLMEKEEPK